jgi:hypothetical protein
MKILILLTISILVLTSCESDSPVNPTEQTVKMPGKGSWVRYYSLLRAAARGPSWDSVVRYQKCSTEKLDTSVAGRSKCWEQNGMANRHYFSIDKELSYSFLVPLTPWGYEGPTHPFPWLPMNRDIGVVSTDSLTFDEVLWDVVTDHSKLDSLMNRNFKRWIVSGSKISDESLTINSSEIATSKYVFRYYYKHYVDGKLEWSSPPDEHTFWFAPSLGVIVKGHVFYPGNEPIYDETVDYVLYDYLLK